MTLPTAEAILAILVECCGYTPDLCRGLDPFVPWCIEGCRAVEYRFQGSLGFGGKFYCERDRWKVSAYPEDLTPERRAAIDEANRRLADLFANCHV